MRRAWLVLLLCARAWADVPTATYPVAVYRLDPLGLDPERALRLEALFRAEIERMNKIPPPARSVVEAALTKDASLRGCAGEPTCLGAVARRLDAQTIVAGNVAQLGDSYVVNLKLVDAKGTEIQRVSEPLKGSADDLIEAVRVAAYRLVRPQELKGSLAILCDAPGADVVLDGKSVGKTPLVKPLEGIDVGKHTLKLEARGYTTFESAVDVRFQKTTEVVVRLLLIGGPIEAPPEAPTPWYTSPWMYVAVGAGAVVLGFFVGRALAKDSTIDCTKDPMSCMPR